MRRSHCSAACSDAHFSTSSGPAAACALVGFLAGVRVLLGVLLALRVALVRLLGLLRCAVRSLTVAALAFLALLALLLVAGSLPPAARRSDSLPVGVALGLLALALILRLLLLRVVLQELLDEIAVVARVLVLGLERQRLVVRRDRGRKLAGLRERVAAVVVRSRRVDARERRGALLELARAILRGAAPLRVLEQLRGARRLLGLQRLEAALVGPLPEILPLERVRARHGREHDEHPHRDPAAAEAQRQQRQQHDGEHDAAIEPDVGLVSLAGRIVERHVERQRGRRPGTTCRGRGRSARARA